MPQLTIYKASAGSGKTFRLVLEYLKLLVDNPFNYRHILAVTFTNKATAEMKERILRDLYKLVQYKDRSILDRLLDETNLSELKILEHAKLALSYILHDYDRFSISTIDSFFQRVLRSFARETGLYGTYEVELDQDAVLDEACDLLLMSVEDDLELRNWLLSMSEDQLGEGKNWQIRDKILELGTELQKEAYQEYLVQQSIAGNIDSEREKISKLKSELALTRKVFETRLREYGNKALNIIRNSGLLLSDFKGGSRSFVNYFDYWANCRLDKLEATKTLLSAVDEPDNWAMKSSPRKEEILNCFHNGLNQALMDALDFLNKELSNYITASGIYKHLYALGVLSILSSKVREVGQERNSLLLNEGSILLKGIIGNNDAPFIYEKTGNTYHYFMIDEFQDTSVTQWENFKPLVINSMAENHPNLLVGDVKQSIYRWRNSDWQLLNKHIKTELENFNLSEITLESNWRSCVNVVGFNNIFFKMAKDYVQNEFNNILNDNHSELFNEYRTTILNAYSDVGQLAASGKEGGYVQCEFIDKDDYEDDTIAKLIKSIEQVQDKGFQAGDIAILVKRNKEGKKIAEALLNHKKRTEKYNFEVISEDSLFIDSSASVRFLVGLIKYTLSPFDQVNQASVVYEYSTNILPLLVQKKKVPQRFVDKGQQQFSFDLETVSKHQFISHQVRSDYFPFFDDEEKRTKIKSWSNLSLIDITEEFIKRYNLDCISGEQANLQSFKDVVSDFSKRESGNLHKFIDWWKQFGAKVKIQTTGERNAIRIMTIHKSKGLEFPVVMLPYCDWTIAPDGKKTNILWCSTSNTAYKQFPVLPVNFSHNLKKSDFREQYFTEVLLSMIDNMNVLYVALTRAINGLYVFTRQIDKKESNISVSGLFNETLKNNDGDYLPKSITEQSYCFGELVRTTEVSTKQAEINLSGKINRKSKLSDSLKLRRNFVGFLDGDENVMSHKLNEGKLMHELLSEIRNAGDLDGSMQKSLVDGKIEFEQLDELKKNILKLMANTKAKGWFDGTLKVLNETTIILPMFGLLRPDRIMISGNNAIVVDYKTTLVKNKAHKAQVSSYVERIKQMGYANVKGYVWYLKSNKVLDIDVDFD